MDRPTKADVDRALEWGDRKYHTADGPVRVLGAEVRALREERDHWRHQAKYATDSSELQPGEEAYERLQAENAKLREELAEARLVNAAVATGSGNVASLVNDLLESRAQIPEVTALVKAARALVESADQASAFIAHVHNDRVDALWAALKPFEGE